MEEKIQRTGTPVYLSRDEQRRIRLAAAGAEVSMSEYIRRAALWAAENDIEEATQSRKEVSDAT